MRKNGIDANSPAPERSPAARTGDNDPERGGGAAQFMIGVRKDEVEGCAAPARAKENPMPRTHRELGEAIFAAEDPVKAGRELLNKETSEDRGAPTRLRSLQTFADWAFEKPGAEGKPPRIIWDIPGPPYEPVDPLETELERLEGGKK
jgi:hypothetical protein